jgi:hypothetical protein
MKRLPRSAGLLVAATLVSAAPAVITAAAVAPAVVPTTAVASATTAPDNLIWD